MHDLRHSFPGQERNEIVFIFARPYFLAFLPALILFAISYLFAFGTQYVISNNILLEVSSLTSNVIVLIMGVFQLVALVVLLVALMDFYLDILIVTNQRLVDIDQQQLFSRPIAELNLSDVEDVKSDVTGFFHTIFNYGTVQIQTAGATTNFIAPNLKHPREITSIVADLSQQSKENIEPALRTPRTRVVGVIENKPLNSLAEMQKVGALLPEDIHRFAHIDAS